MTISFKTGETAISRKGLNALIEELTRRLSEEVLTLEIGEPTLQKLRQEAAARDEFSQEDAWPLIGLALKHGFFDVLPAHGVPSVSYDLGAPFDLLGAPLGFDEEVPLVPLNPHFPSDRSI